MELQGKKLEVVGGKSKKMKGGKRKLTREEKKKLDPHQYNFYLLPEPVKYR